MSNRTRIAKVLGRQVWDSRGWPTVEAEVHLDSGVIGRAIAPVGISRGSGEAVELRDGGDKHGGYGVHQAVSSVNREIASVLSGLDVRDQTQCDYNLKELGGEGKTRIGANTSIAVSMAVAHTAAQAANVPLWQYLAGDRVVNLPLPEIQIFGGGAHADQQIDFQDFMVVCPGARSLREALDWTSEIYRAAQKFMKLKGRRGGVADQGGLWPDFTNNEEALEFLLQAILSTGLKAPEQVGIAVDIAASEFYRDDHYCLASDGQSLKSLDFITKLEKLVERFPILSYEDPLAETDEASFRILTNRIGDYIQIVGDDLFASNTIRIHARKSLANTVLIKPSQIGTLTEAKEAFDAAKQCGLGAIVSARSGDSEDVTIAHLAVGWGALGIKIGGFQRSERLAKCNELLRIEESLINSTFVGFEGLHRLIKAVNDI